MRWRGFTLLAIAAGLAAIVPAAADAHKIDVRKGDSIQKAIAKAKAGDAILIHPGTYHGALVIRKAISLSGVGGKTPVIDADCKANDAISVEHAGASLTHLRVQGADVVDTGESYPAEVYFSGITSGKATDLQTIDTCDAEYGISAFGTGPLRITDNYGRGFSDSAIYIGSIVDTLGGTLIVEDNTTVGNSRGIIVEDSPAETDIVVRGNTMSNNTIVGDDGPSDGLYIRNSDGVYVADNIADGNGASGYHADASSDHNIFRDNTASGNVLAPFTDDNGDNCGYGNSFEVPRHCS